MMNKIMDLVKNQVMDKVAGISGIPEDKRGETVKVATDSLMGGLKKIATSGGISNLTSMFGSGGKQGAASGEMTGALESGVVSALMSKVGLDQSMAGKISASIIPAVMSLLKGKVNDSSEPDFNIGSLVGTLSGKSGGGIGGVMSMVGSLFGRKK